MRVVQALLTLVVGLMMLTSFGLCAFGIYEARITPGNDRYGDMAFIAALAFWMLAYGFSILEDE